MLGKGIEKTLSLTNKKLVALQRPIKVGANEILNALAVPFHNFKYCFLVEDAVEDLCVQSPHCKTHGDKRETNSGASFRFKFYPTRYVFISKLTNLKGSC